MGNAPTRFRDRVAQLCAEYPGAPAIEFAGLHTSWGDVSDRMDALQSVLLATGLGATDAVGVVVRDRPPAVSALLALLARGRPIALMQSLASDTELCADVRRLSVGAVVAEARDWARDVVVCCRSRVVIIDAGRDHKQGDRRVAKLGLYLDLRNPPGWHQEPHRLYTSLRCSATSNI